MAQSNSSSLRLNFKWSLLIVGLAFGLSVWWALQSLFGNIIGHGLAAEMIVAGVSAVFGTMGSFLVTGLIFRLWTGAHAQSVANGADDSTHVGGQDAPKELAFSVRSFAGLILGSGKLPKETNSHKEK